MKKIKGRLGFGCMRLPLTDGKVDIKAFSQMVDCFMDSGFNYFDTAHGYIDEMSEGAVRRAVVERYPRDSFFLANKLTGSYFKSRKDILPFFENQLKECGVDYFDLYLMHSQNAKSYEHFKSNGAYEEACKLKEQGRVRHVGISFHDTAEVLERILDEQPDIEIVQLQINYLDYDSPSVQSRLCYEVCKRRGLPVIVMEPVKGGSLANLPEDARSVLDSLGGSPASYAIRFAAGLPQVKVVLSGMGSADMVSENVGFMKDFKPLDEGELRAISKVREIMNAKHLIGCTNCRYCMAGCPAGIKIPDLISCYNQTKLFGDWSGEFYYGIHTNGAALASECIGCGACEDICPQSLEIRNNLRDIATLYERDTEKDAPKEDRKRLTERVEDALDETLYKIQNALYGERKSLKTDIPATMETPDGFRRIIRYATRRNIGLKLIRNPKFLLTIIGIIVAIVVIASILP